eukprot:261859-Lingulodinium_polyedra.AAC.1
MPPPRPGPRPRGSRCAWPRPGPPRAPRPRGNTAPTRPVAARDAGRPDYPRELVPDGCHDGVIAHVPHQ